MNTDNPPIVIACVLKRGKYYNASWVRALKCGLERHVRRNYEFKVLTDFGDLGEWQIPLAKGWSGWWSKLELFDGRLTGRVLYLDLDTLVVGDLEDILNYDGDFAMLSDFYRPSLLQSGVMAFDAGGDTAHRIWSTWIRDPWGWMHRFRGDGEFIASVATDADRLQDLFPGQVLSLKVHAWDARPEGAHLVCGHGRPRMDRPEAGWAHEEWKII